jgi:hypothetical protein
MSLARRQPSTGASSYPGLGIPKGPPRPTASDRRRAEGVRRPRCRRAPGGLQKPALGTAARERRAEARLLKRIELLAKTEAKIRDDFRCRYPGCTVRGREFVEAMHIQNSGMGGRRSVGNRSGCFVTGCREHHRGRRSIHSAHIEMMLTSDAGGDAPIAWNERATLDSPWRYVGTTNPVFPVTRA